MNRSRRLLLSAAAATLCCLLPACVLVPARAALFGREDAPCAVAAFAKSDVTGATVSFTADDFLSRVSGREELSAVVLSALPESGTLRLAGRPLVRGEAVETASLGALSYVPEEGAEEVHTFFCFLPVFSRSGAAAEAVTVSLNLSAQPNSAPIARELSLPTYAGVALCGSFRAYDPDGDPCTYAIAEQPSRGTVEVREDGFVYTPAAGKSGRDAFSYTATDRYGNVSAPASVSVDVEKRPGKDAFTYTDLSGHPCHYDALRLRDAGVLCGETIGADSFLYPERTVSRAEFVALVASVSELVLPTAAIGTGLADDGAIPAWAQPYVAAALVSGVVHGESDGSGNRVFRAQDAITRAEAAAVIDRALSLPDDGRAMAFGDTADVPAWAAQEVVNCTAAGVLPVFSDNTVRCADAVTRADAVGMLSAMLTYRENARPSGLLGLLAG